MGRGPTKKALRREREILRSKAHAQRRHATHRMEERYDVTILRAGLKQMVSAIQKDARPRGRARFYDRQSNRITRWHVEYEGTWYPVVYDSKRQTIVTVLPLGALGSSPETKGRP